MKINICRAVFLSLIISSGIVRADSEQEKSLPAFVAGEKLSYSLGWQFIVVGHSVAEVQPDMDFEGRKVRGFKMKARTNRFADQIFKVRDNLSALAEYDLSRSLFYEKDQTEGKTRRDVTVTFDWNKGVANYIEAIKNQSVTTAVMDNTLDPLSAVYYVRMQKLDVGTVVSGPITDGKRCKVGEIKVISREEIKVHGKKYDTFKMVADMKDVGGVFEKSGNADVHIWVTADYRHIPVLMKSKVVVGSFVAELEEIN